MLIEEEDFKNWEKLSQRCDLLDELTFIEKEKAKRSFLFLRDEFGKDFLNKAFNEGHPICWYILNQAPWTRRWVAYLADMLSEVKNKNGYNDLLERIKDKDRFGEGFSVLENAYKFSKAGLDISFDPEIKVYNKIKKPDLKLIDKNNKEELFVEISNLNTSIQMKEVEETNMPISMCLMKYASYLSFCVHIYKVIYQNHLNDIVRELENKIKKSIEENIFQELIEENVIEIGIAPKTNEMLLKNWALHRGLTIGEIIGPPIEVDEIFRIRQKIANEQKQLPIDYSNILIIGNNQPQLITGFDYENIKEKLIETIYKHSKLLFIIIFNKYHSFGENNYEFSIKNDYIYVRKNIPNLFSTEQYLVIINKYCREKEKVNYAFSLANSFLGRN